MKRNSWATTNNYNKAPSGRVVVGWPYDAITYAALGRIFGRLAHRASTADKELPILPKSAPPRHAEEVGVAQDKGFAEDRVG
jgi:hypothetical protein